MNKSTVIAYFSHWLSKFSIWGFILYAVEVSKTNWKFTKFTRTLRSRSSHRWCSAKKVFLEFIANFTGKHLYWSLCLIKLQAFRPTTLLQRDSTGVFCEICEIFKITYFEEHLRTAASREACIIKRTTIPEKIFGTNSSFYMK